MRPLSHIGSKLKEIPEGYMGKVLVYRSGKVKMKIGDALFDVRIETWRCHIFCLRFSMQYWSHINKLCRFHLARIACLSRRLQQSTPEKNIAVRWGRSASVLLSPQILTTCWVLLTRWKNSPLVPLEQTMTILCHYKGVLLLIENNLWYPFRPTSWRKDVSRQ